MGEQDSAKVQCNLGITWAGLHCHNALLCFGDGLQNLCVIGRYSSKVCAHVEAQLLLCRNGCSLCAEDAHMSATATFDAP